MSYWLLLGSLPALPASRSVRFPPQIQLPKTRPVRRLVAVSCTHRHTHRACTPMHARGFPRVCSHTHMHLCVYTCVLTVMHTHVCPVSRRWFVSLPVRGSGLGGVPRRGDDSRALLLSSPAKSRPLPWASGLCPPALPALAPWRGGWLWGARLGHEFAGSCAAAPRRPCLQPPPLVVARAAARLRHAPRPRVAEGTASPRRRHLGAGRAGNASLPVAGRTLLRFRAA